MNDLLRIEGAFGYGILELIIVGIIICAVIYVAFRLLGK